MIVRFFDKETNSSKKVGFEITADDSPYVWPYFTQIVVSGGDTTVVIDSTLVLLPLNPITNTSTYYFNSDTSSHRIEMSYDTLMTLPIDDGHEVTISFGFAV